MLWLHCKVQEVEQCWLPQAGLASLAKWNEDLHWWFFPGLGFPCKSCVYLELLLYVLYFSHILYYLMLENPNNWYQSDVRFWLLVKNI